MVPAWGKTEGLPSNYSLMQDWTQIEMIILKKLPYIDWAVKNCKEDMVKLLVERGANPCTTNNHGYSRVNNGTC